MLKDCYEGIGSSSPLYYTVVDDQLFFRAATGAQGEELWVSDGTTDGTVLVRDLYGGTSSSLLGHFTGHNGELYFKAYPDFGVNHLYRSDGTYEGTVPLPHPAYDYNIPEGMHSHNGWLYFFAYGDFGRQLWRTDGTAEGSTEILYPGPTANQPMENASYLSSCGGELIFRGGYIDGLGYELYALTSSVGMDAPTKAKIGVFPNPTSDQLQISGFPANSNFMLYATDGRTIMNTPAKASMDVTSLPAGPYLARITDATGGIVHSQLVIVQH